MDQKWQLFYKSVKKKLTKRFILLIKVLLFPLNIKNLSMSNFELAFHIEKVLSVFVTQVV